MFFDFIDEKWPELLILAGVGMSSFALIVSFL